MLKDIDLNLNSKTDIEYSKKPVVAVGAVENLVNNLEINELAHQIETETHKLYYTIETITGIENSLVASIESGKIIVTDIVELVANNINNMNNEKILDLYRGNIIIGKENSVYLESIMDRIKKAGKFMIEKIKNILKKIKNFFKKLINRILNKKSSSGGSGGGGSGTSKLINKTEEDNLNKLIELINKGDVKLITEYINIHYRSYRELLMELEKHEDKIKINIDTKDKEVTISNIEVKDFKALEKLHLSGVSKEANKHFDVIKNNIYFFNKFRKSTLYTHTKESEILLDYNSLYLKLDKYSKALKEIAKDVTIGKLISVEGKIGGIDIDKLRLVDFILSIQNLSISLPKCVESIENKSDKLLTRDKSKNDRIKSCLNKELKETYLKNVTLSNNPNNDVNLKPTDPITLFSLLTLDINKFKSELQNKIYKNSNTFSKMKAIGIIGVLFDSVAFKEIKEKDLLDKIEIIVNLNIELKNDIKRELRNNIGIISNYLNVGKIIDDINDDLTVTLTTISNLINVIDRQITEFDKNNKKYLSKINSIIIKNIVFPLKNMTNIAGRFSRLFEVEKMTLDNARDSYAGIIKEMYHLAIVKKAMDVINNK